MSDDELVILLDDEPDHGDQQIIGRWKIVVIDDDQAVHDGTRFALHDYVLHGFGLDIISAYSAKEGRQVLAENPDTAVVLLDVVMETDTAGLELVGQIREELKNETVRIILRTGQPGQAPERRVIVDYDINDYKAKTELTADKLFTTLTAALRSYDQLRRMDETRRGLEVIIEAASALFDFQSIERLAGAILNGLASVVGAPGDGVVVVRDSDITPDDKIIAGTGRYAGAHRPGTMHDLHSGIRELIDAAFASSAADSGADTCIEIGDTGAAVHIETRTGRRIVIALDANRPLSDTDRSLIEVFCTRLPVAFDNVALYAELQETNARLEERVASRTEELARANGFKKEILGIVAHDLKNPLSVILGRADMLGEQITRDPIRTDNVVKHVTEIGKSARRMTEMIEGLLAEAMNDAVDISIRPASLDIGRLITTVAEANQPLADRKSQSITVAAPKPLTVSADYQRLREAIDNLVSNAIKYSPSGGQIGLSSQIEDGDAVIRVSDSGPGLSDEDMARLFGRFQRLSAKPTGGESSSGLGLSIVKRIVELHDGHIWAERPGPYGGTSFCISLPLEK